MLPLHNPTITSTASIASGVNVTTSYIHTHIALRV
jgi:hypothetical protein